MATKKIIMLAVVLPVTLAVLGVGGYFGYNAMIKQDAKNNKDLEKFGLAVLPQTTTPITRTPEEQHAIYQESTGILGASQQVASFPDEKLNPTQKVIRGLMSDKEALLAEQDELKAHIEELNTRIAELEEYKRLNEHFAPDSMDEELSKVKAKLKKALLNTPSASRFNNRQIDIMSAASTAEYEKFIRHNRLILSEFQRDELVRLYLPEFAFCLGDGVDLATNSASEERLLTRFFESPETTELPAVLLKDFETVLKPCQGLLHDRLAKYSPGAQ